jgi:hypothetical protein
VAVLYGESVRFLCRHCYKLPYTSQCEDRIDRMIRKREKIRRRLRLDGGAGPGYERPKGMHRSTYERLMKEEIEVWMAIDDEIERRMVKFEHLLNDKHDKHDKHDKQDEIDVPMSSNAYNRVI